MKQLSAFFVVLLLASPALFSQATGPWNSALMIATSPDGTTFSNTQVFQDSSGVPNVIMLSDGRLVCAFQWFPAPMHGDNWDSVAVKFSSDTGITWTAPMHCNFSGAPAGFQRPFDPALADAGGGQIRMYFSDGPLTAAQLDSNINTYSAISNDGVNYVFEGLARFDDDSLPVIDPTITYFNGAWQYIAPRGAPQAGAFHGTSGDGLTFAALANITSDNTHQWTGNVMVDDTVMRFYGCGNASTLWWASSSDGITWSTYNNTNRNGGDPAVTKLPDGTFLMIWVGPPNLTSVFSDPNPAKPMQLFPNPSAGPVNVLMAQSGNYELSVFDVTGKKVAGSNFTGTSTTLDTEAFSPGMYYIEIFDPQQQVIYGEKLLR